MAHPPGYPLLTILGRIWLCICPVSIAFSLNLLNAIIASAANYALYNTISVAAGRELPAIIGTLWFGFSKNVWEWNTQFENYALNNFLVASLLYVYIGKAQIHRSQIIIPNRLLLQKICKIGSPDSGFPKRAEKRVGNNKF